MHLPQHFSNADTGNTPNQRNVFPYEIGMSRAVRTLVQEV